MRRTRLSVCERKLRYPNFAEAQAAGRSEGQRAYRCDKCRLWHLTSRRRA